MDNFMFDTVAFNRVLDGAVTQERLRSDFKLYATHVQEDELNNTPDENRRAALAKIFQEFIGRKLPTESTVLDVSRLGESKLGGGKVPTETAVWGVTPWGEGKWGADGGLYSQIKAHLDGLKKKDNNVQDALIAETAIMNMHTLVTDDQALTIAVKSLNSPVISFSEFLRIATA